MRNIIMLTIITACIWVIYLSISFTGLFDGDAMEYADIGRNILQGKGFYSNSIFPVGLSFSHIPPFPSLRRLPLFPLFLACSFKIFSVSDMSVVLVTGLFFIFTIPVIYLLSFRIFARKDVAVLSSLFYIFNNNAAFYATNGLTEPMFAFLFTLAILFILKRTSLSFIFIGGFLLGLAQLTRPNAVLYLIPIIIYVVISVDRTKRLTAGALFFAGFIIPVSYMLIYNYINIGNPFFSLFRYIPLEATPEYPGHAIQRILNPPNVGTYIISHPKVFLVRNIRYLFNQYHTFYRLIGPVLTCFFVVSILRWHKDVQIIKPRLLLYSAILIQILFNSFTLGDIRYCFHFIPLILIFTSEYLCSCLDNLEPLFKRFRYFKIVLIAVLFIIFISPIQIQAVRAFKDKFIEHKNPMAFIPDHPVGAYPKTGQLIKKWTQPGELVLSDAGWVVAWYGERLGLRIPLMHEDMETIEKKYGIRIDAILLTSDLLNWYDADPAWKMLLQEKITLPDYKLAERLELPGYKAILYRRIL